MGMPADEYWHGRFSLVRGYREAYELKKEAKEYELWKQGMYIYESLLNVSPILHAFAKNGTKPLPYPDKPYGIKEQEKTEEDLEREAEQERVKAKIHFMSLVMAYKKKFKDGE